MSSNALVANYYVGDAIERESGFVRHLDPRSSQPFLPDQLGSFADELSFIQPVHELFSISLARKSQG